MGMEEREGKEKNFGGLGSACTEESMAHKREHRT